ncbi:MAG TPA: hypothetical protein VF503_25065 [Sphingobium sp.]|uniref:hypothetical protein n=1 Tax=Sphingobium sp. TaxID=1912891 RepID=UPI002ED06E52
MKGSSQLALCVYRVEIAFFSGDLRYGAEIYEITASNWYQAELEGLARSVESVLDNERVPDVRRIATARPA